jgi:hypothetical protein
MYHRLLLYTLTLLAFLGTASAQEPTDQVLRSGHTTEGREFWLVFQKNFRDYVTDQQTQGRRPAEPLQLELFITSSQTARGTIEISGLGFRKPFVVQAGKVINITIDTAAQVRSSERIEDLAVHIVADQPIAVYGLNRRYQTTDTYLAYPVNVLGTSYRAVGYGWLESDLLSQVAIIGTQDGTRVRVTPTVRTQKGKPAGIPFEVKLDAGDVYQIMPQYDPRTTSDLTGTLIESDAPVAVFSGHNCAYVPDLKTKACNLLVEQLPPLNSWGTQFFVGTLAGRSSAAMRVLARDDNTQVFENNVLVKTLNAGEYYDNKDQKRLTMLKSDKPVLVTQYSKGFDNGDNVGDPMMIVVAPTEQFLASYRFATPVRGSWHHYVNLIVPTATIPQMRLDDKPIDPTTFQPFGLSLYSIAQVEVNYGTHVITGPEPFGLYSYGFGYDDASYDAYGNGGGQSMQRVVQYPDTMAPTLSASFRKNRQSVSAIVRDDRVNDKGLESINVIDEENMAPIPVGFAPGAPQVEMVLEIGEAKRNAYSKLQLRDRAGNVSFYTICVTYDPVTDSTTLSVLPDGRSCEFAQDLSIGGLLKYSILEHDVTIPAGEAPVNSPVALQGSGGTPVWGIHAFAEMPYTQDIYLTGRVGLDFWKGNAFGALPDSLQSRASDGVTIAEEFQLERNVAMLTLGPGAHYYFAERKAYLFGLLNISFPISASERLTRTIVSPSDYLYSNGERTIAEYDEGGPDGLPILITPELGIGAVVDVRHGWKVYGELGGGYSLTSFSPDRDWSVSYLFARMGAKVRL